MVVSYHLLLILCNKGCYITEFGGRSISITENYACFSSWVCRCPHFVKTPLSYSKKYIIIDKDLSSIILKNVLHFRICFSKYTLLFINTADTIDELNLTLALTLTQFWISLSTLK